MILFKIPLLVLMAWVKDKWSISIYLKYNIFLFVTKEKSMQDIWILKVQKSKIQKYTTSWTSGV
jgi:hypothetical protein